MIITIAVIAFFLIRDYMQKYFKSEKVREKIIRGESFLLNKKGGIIRITIGVVMYIIAMLIVAENKYYDVLNIVFGVILIDLVVEVNNAIKAIDSE